LPEAVELAMAAEPVLVAEPDMPAAAPERVCVAVTPAAEAAAQICPISGRTDERDGPGTAEAVHVSSVCAQ